jgi:hypothetical protein
MGIKILFQNLKKYGLKGFIKKWKSGIDEVNDGASPYYTQNTALKQQIFGLWLMIIGSVAAATYLGINGMWFWSVISITPLFMWSSQLKMMYKSKETLTKIQEEQNKIMEENENV